MRGYRTPLLRLLRKTVHAHRTHGFGTSVPSLPERRQFLKQSTMVIAGVGLTPAFLAACAREAGRARTAPRIAILGAGLAGLSAGHALRKRGVLFEIYEATSRAGGRVFSVQDAVVDGSVAELGGEFIDSNHEDMLALAKEFDLTLVDLPETVKKQGLTAEAFFINGRHYTEEQLIAEFAKFAPAVSADIEALDGEDETILARFDAMSIPGYLRSTNVPAWVVALLSAAYTGEYGIDAEEQSALNLLYMLDPSTSEGVRVFGESDERFRIRGGNQLLIDRLAESMREQIRFGHRCTSIARSEGAYALSFDNGSIITADYLIVAIPFTVLRGIELAVEIPEEKRRAIDELSYGTNSKLILGYASRPWQQSGFSGQLFSERVHNGWDAGAANPEIEAGAYTVFLGGRDGAALEESKADTYARELDRVFPGSGSQRTSRQVVYNWSRTDTVRGSYAAYRKGQWSTIAGHEATPVGHMFFAGEHCSEDFQGYMNGAAETGRVAAEQIAELVLGKA